MLLYRHHITAFLQALLILCAFASCIGDEFADGAATSSTPKECYLYLQIHSTSDWSQTRATYGEAEGDEAGNGDFVHGEEDEHKIGNSGNFVIFFDEDEKLFSIEQLILTDHKDDPGHDPEIKGDENYIEARYMTKFYPDETANWPKWCLVVLNGENIYQQLVQNTTKGQTELQTVLSTIWSVSGNQDPRNIGRTDDGLFTMTNSSYVYEGKVHTAVEIPEDYIPTSSSDEEKVLHVHVERMAAKFSFQSEKSTFPIFQPSENPDITVFSGFNDETNAPQYVLKKWRIKVTGWNVNALERKNYIFKNITPTAEYFGKTTKWNDDEHYRSYWSEDPDYSKDAYPWQYRWSIDAVELKYYEDLENKSENILRNYSFNELKLGSLDWANSVYAPEHTYNADLVANKLDDREELLAGTHLLVGAELQIEEDKKTGGSTPETEVDVENGENDNENYVTADIYRSRSGLYYRSERNCFAALVHVFNQSLTSQEAMEFNLYDWEKGGKLKFDNIKDNDTLAVNTSGQYALYYDGRKLDDDYLKTIMAEWSDSKFTEEIGSLAPATLHHGDGKCMPWIENSIENGKLTIKNADGGLLSIEGIGKKDHNKYGAVIVGEKVDIGSGNYNNFIKSLLYEWLGAIDHFKDGKMYYTHGIYNQLSANDEKHWGVVRNNWYQLNLKDITSMGVPVDEPDQPIVPERVGLNDQVNVSVYIIPWHKVEAVTPPLDE